MAWDLRPSDPFTADFADLADFGIGPLSSAAPSPQVLRHA